MDNPEARAELKRDFFDALNAAGLTKRAYAEEIGYSVRMLEYHFAGEHHSARLEVLIERFIREQVPVMKKRAGEMERRWGRAA